MTDLLGIGQRIPSRIRQTDRMSDPVKKLGAHFLFQLLDLEGYCGLGVAQFLTGTGKAAQFRRFYKDIEAPNIHITPLFLLFPTILLYMLTI